MLLKELKMIEAMCLALTVYYEARSEPVRGQYKVAEVVMNRVKSDNYPDTICKVMEQDTGPLKDDCQFSFYCDGKPEKPAEDIPWLFAQIIAYDVIEHGVQDNTGATHYHATYSKPYWRNKLKYLYQIGRHKFYKEVR